MARVTARRLAVIGAALAGLVAAVTSAQAAIPCPLKLGSLRPSSGVMASIGASMANGLQMGLDEINTKGGIAGCQVSLVAYDTQSSPATAATLARRLISQDGMPLIIATPISLEVLAMMEITENLGVPLYVPSAASAKVTNQGFKWVWRQSVIDSSAAALMAKYVAASLKWKRVGVVYENSDFGKPTYLNTLKPVMEANGVTIATAEAINAGDTDLSGQLLRIRDAGVEGIVFWGHAKEAALLLQQNLSLNVNLPFAGDPGIVYPEFLEILSPDVQAGTKLIAVAQFVWTAQDPAERAWIDTYKTRFNRLPDATAIDAYDAVFVLKKAIEAARSLDAEALQKALSAVSYTGVGGAISFDKTGQALRPLVIVELTPKDGPGFRELKVIQPNAQ